MVMARRDASKDAEFLRTLRRELFDRLLIVNERHLRQVLNDYLLHYNTARPHRALGQLTPTQAVTQSPEINFAREYRMHRKQPSEDSHTSTRSPPNSPRPDTRSPRSLARSYIRSRQDG
jgi:hypothetical protein